MFEKHTMHNTLMRVLFLSVVTLSWGQGAGLRVLGNLDRIYNLDVDWGDMLCEILKFLWTDIQRVYFYAYGCVYYVIVYTETAYRRPLAACATEYLRFFFEIFGISNHMIVDTCSCLEIKKISCLNVEIM